VPATGVLIQPLLGTWNPAYGVVRTASTPYEDERSALEGARASPVGCPRSVTREAIIVLVRDAVQQLPSFSVLSAPHSNILMN